MPQMFNVVFGTVIVGNSAWLVLCARFLAYLEKRHPDEYAALGRPGVFRNNRPGRSRVFFAFLYGKRPWELPDPALHRRVRFMKYFFAVAALLNVTLGALFWMTFVPHGVSN